MKIVAGNSLRGRRLAAMMFTDVAGYSRLMEENEQVTHGLLEEHNAILRDVFPTYSGREIRTIGDAFFVEFPSAVDAIQCAYQIQSRLYEWNLTLPKSKQFWVRIGVHLGDILDTGDDAYGNEVNISARIEALAKPGGICVSQQVVDQVRGKVGIEFRSQGMADLKNISEKISVHSVVLPWTLKSQTATWLTAVRARFEKVFHQTIGSQDLAVRTLLGAMVFGLTAYVSIPISQSLKDSLLPSVFKIGLRGPAGQAATQPLNDGWKILTNPSKGENWEDFNPAESWKFADAVRGEYWLKKEFVLETKYEYPAVVLGLIPNRHRVFLNGTFIGGMDHQNPVSYYAFDSKMIQAGSANTLLVKAHSEGSLKPGLTIVPRVGAAIGELSQITPLTRLDLVLYHDLRMFYLSVTVMFFMGFLLYYAMNPVSRQFLYYSLYTLMGAILLVYQNPVLSDQLDYKSYSFLKTFPLAMSALILTSAYFAMRGNRNAEMRNNLGAMAYGLVLFAALLLSGDAKPSAFQERTNTFYLISSIYAAVMTAYVIAKTVQRARFAGMMTSSERWNALAYDGATLTFLAYNTLFSLVSIRGGSLFQFTPEMRNLTQQVLVGYPVLFVSSIFVVAMIDYTLKNHALRMRTNTDDLVMTISRVVADGGKAQEKVAEVHRLICEFLGVTQSSIYRLENELAKARSIIAPVTQKSLIHAQLNTTDGIIGYVVRKQSPVIIRDVARDLRFRDFILNRSKGQPFMTSSCMVFPLMAFGKVQGVATFTEKKDGLAFNRQDFQLVQILVKDLALVMANEPAADPNSEKRLRSA